MSIYDRDGHAEFSDLDAACPQYLEACARHDLKMCPGLQDALQKLRAICQSTRAGSWNYAVDWLGPPVVKQQRVPVILIAELQFAFDRELHVYVDYALTGVVSVYAEIVMGLFCVRLTDLLGKTQLHCTAPLHGVHVRAMESLCYQAAIYKLLVAQPEVDLSAGDCLQVPQKLVDAVIAAFVDVLQTWAAIVLLEISAYPL